MRIPSPKPVRRHISEDEIELLTSAMSQDNTDKFSLVTEEAISRRQIHIIDDVTDASFEQVKNLYDELIDQDCTKPIHFIIGTVGGDVRSMLGIMNLILLSSVPCYTYLFGETCSAGAWIYLCGSKRFAPKTGLASFMLHPMHWNSTDSLGNHDSHNRYIDKIAQNLIKLTCARTKLTPRKLRKLATIETQFFVGEELFEFGIATDVLDSVVFWHSGKQEKPKRDKKQKPEVLIETK